VAATIKTSTKRTPLVFEVLVLLSLLLAVVASACGGGDIQSPKGPVGGQSDMAWWDKPLDSGTPPPPPSADSGAASDAAVPSSDAAPSSKGDGAASNTEAGSPKPDAGSTTPKDAGSFNVPPGVGGPCPCQPGAKCIDAVCRATCAAPTDACKANSLCQANHGCVKSWQGDWVCIPAAKPGTPCPAGATPPVYCPSKHVCGSANSGTFMCLPICDSNADCQNGGACLAAPTGCKFCSKL
jgi:hypothetical protein